MPPFPSGRTMRYGPNRWLGAKRNGRSTGAPLGVGAKDRVASSEDHSAAKSRAGSVRVVDALRVVGSSGCFRSAGPLDSGSIWFRVAALWEPQEPGLIDQQGAGILD